MRFLIYGAGALGQAIGCMLAADGHHIDLILRDRFIKSVSENGLKVTGILGEFIAPKTNYSLLASIASATKSYDFVLITTKAYNTAEAVRDIATLGDRGARVVSMQNGCGNVELLEQQFGPEKSLGARVITGFEITQPGTIAITVSADAIHVGGSRCGAIPESARTLAAMIDSAGHPALAVADVHQSLFAKLLYNCSLNPLGAILGVHYGALVERQETRELLDRVIEETFGVIAALGGRTPWPDAEAYKEVFYRKLVPATYNHRPSMLQDLENGKPTEVDALIGYVSKQGKRLGLPTTTCDILAALVKFKEAPGRGSIR
ncbi:MAG: 2-dehydropantoate 2-reductase [uncultured bacterium]|nr:MAG: 2-dehydropantoate 2-reductase [uncultured bacterium]